jgi:acyl dehydratase
MAVQWTTSMHAATQTAAGVLVTTRTKMCDPQREPLAAHFWSSLHIGGIIDADAAVAYALATNDPNDVYLRSDAVPPLFTASLLRDRLADAEGGDVVLSAIRDARGGVHGQHDVHVFRPLRRGMAVQWTTSMHAAKQTAAGVLVTTRTMMCDPQREPLAAHFWSSLHIGGIIDADVGPDIPDHTFPLHARQRPVGSQIVDIAADQGFRFAGASGDRVAHSIDDEAARQEGYPGKILQGLCTLSMCCGAVVKLGAEGDPDRVRRFAGRFSAPMFPRAKLVVDVFDAGTTDDGARVLVFEAMADGVPVVKHGRAELLAS